MDIPSKEKIQSAVVGMYSSHPSPSKKDKIAFASHRMKLRLRSCGITEDDYVNKEVLDAGCGTGEYSCWLASNGARVHGIDLSDGSLSEARNFAKEMNISAVYFEKRSVLDTQFEDNRFNFVYCTGVLHHTADPFGGLKELTRIVRPGGKILVSFYNSYGFLPRELRRQIAKYLGGEDLQKRVLWGRRLFPFTTRRLEKGDRNDFESALYDYFAIPHQSLHSVQEVVSWFDQLGLTYTGGFPPVSWNDNIAMFRERDYQSVESNFYSPIGSLVGRIWGDTIYRYTRPSRFTLSLIQSLWLLAGIDIFSLSGQKK